MSRSKSIRWRGDDFANYSKHLGEYKGKILDDLYTELKKLGEYGESLVKRRIDTAGTLTRPENRRETSAMYNSVTHSVSRVGDDVVLRFGWPDGGPAYTRMQDLGTRSLYDKRVDAFNKPGPGIPAMLALLDSFVEVRNEAQDRGL